MKFLVDRALLAWAVEEERVLITMDKDFGELVFVQARPHCGMICLPDVPASKRITIVEEILQHHAQALADQAVVTVRGGRIRISQAKG